MRFDEMPRIISLVSRRKLLNAASDHVDGNRADLNHSGQRSQLAPGAAHLFPDPLKRPAGMAQFFRIALRYGQKHGRVDVIQSSGAVAVWMPPENTTRDWTHLVRAGCLATPFFVGWSATRRMLKFERFIERCRKRALDVPRWYLFCIGVRPDQQGQGLGAALIRLGLKRAQSTGVPCYQETANARNLPFYQKHGFRVVAEKHLPDAGPGIWSLVAG